MNLDIDEDFVGKEALIERKAHPQRTLVGLELAGNETAGHGDCVHEAGGRSQIGVITSGTRSPTLRKNIALCRMSTQYAEARHRGRGRQARRPPEADPGDGGAVPVLRPEEGAPAQLVGFSPIPDAGPFLEHVGPVLADGDVVGLRIEARHLNRSGMAQGGLLATVVDFALGRAIRASAQDEQRAATVSLTTDFLGAAREGDFVEARTEVERLGGTLAFADCSLTVDGREIVRGRAVFAVLTDGEG